MYYDTCSKSPINPSVNETHLKLSKLNDPKNLFEIEDFYFYIDGFTGIAVKRSDGWHTAEFLGDSIQNNWVRKDFDLNNYRHVKLTPDNYKISF